MKLIGYYNEQGYRIHDVDNNKDIYSAGNSPYDSQQYVAPEKGVGVDAISCFCEVTGEDIAKERGCEFIGVEYEIKEVT